MKRINLVFSLWFISAVCLAGWTWQNPFSQGNRLVSVFFTVTLTGYSVGESGIILKTVNAGTTWISLASGTPFGLRSVLLPMPIPAI